MPHDFAPPSRKPSRAGLWTGWILSALVALFIGSGGINALRSAPFVLAGVAKFGYPASAVPAVGVAELLCAVLFLIPQTAALGAILFTAFFGGAVASHARIGDPSWPIPMLFAVVVWIALILRDPRFHIIRPSQYSKP